MDGAMEQNAIRENYILDQLLMQSGLIVPYSMDYILLLEEGCRNFIDEKLDNGVFTDLALSYTKNSCKNFLRVCGTHWSSTLCILQLLIMTMRKKKLFTPVCCKTYSFGVKDIGKN